MKFKKDGEVFDSIEDARAAYCNGLHKCEACAIYRVLTRGTCCEFFEENPRKGAELMGFEIIEGEPATPELPLDISGMTLAQAKDYCNRHRNDNCGEDCEFRRRYVCGYGCAIDIYRWNLEIKRLTPGELEICRALNAKYVTRDRSYEGEVVNIWRDNPSVDAEGDYGYNDCGALPIAAISKSIFKSVNRGDCICVDDLFSIER